ncbi:hypothetical protein TNIN_385251, partial [Trichonephila inaurata madagascariensis]
NYLNKIKGLRGKTGQIAASFSIINATIRLKIPCICLHASCKIFGYQESADCQGHPNTVNSI